MVKPLGLSVVRDSEVKRMGVEPYIKFFGNNVVFGKWDATDYVNKYYLHSSALYSIVNRITSVSAQASETFKVYKVKNQAKAARHKQWTGRNATKDSLFQALLTKDDAYEVDDSHPFNELLKKPNDWQGINEFVQTCIGFKLLTGNRYLFMTTLDLGANAGKPFALYNLPPQHITIKQGQTLWSVAGYVLNLGVPVDIPAEVIIHSREWNADFDGMGSHLYGLSPLRANHRNLMRGAAAEDRAVAMLQNAGAAGLVFNKAAESMTVEQAGLLKKKVNEEVLGFENAGKIAIANGDMGYLNFGLTAGDMGLMEQEKYSDEKIANAYKVPPGLFQASANATDNNIAAWNRQLVTQAVIPALADLRDDLNKILGLYGEGYYVDYDINVFPEMQEDQEKLSNILDKSWYLTPNEKRIARGFDEDMSEPMMKRYLVPTTLQDITNLDPSNMDNAMNQIDQGLNNDNLNANP